MHGREHARPDVITEIAWHWRGRISQRLKPIALPPLCDHSLVSILTANYNYAQFIGEAIESAQKQTYTNWEMIICDDGSTDNSCEVVERYMRAIRTVGGSCWYPYDATIFNSF
jgi:cellulose synthase/poly-beta-1,6-N-acetylglucosamine synthase-like glycosyltransferase